MDSIREIRTRLGLSQSEMAKKLGIGTSMLAKAEANDRRLSSITLLKLAEYEKNVQEACPDHTTADRTLSFCKKRLRNNNMALRNLEVKQERMQRCYVIGKELPITTPRCKHQKRVERRHMSCGSAAHQIGEIKLKLLQRENRLLEHFIKGFSRNCTL